MKLRAVTYWQHGAYVLRRHQMRAKGGGPIEWHRREGTRWKKLTPGTADWCEQRVNTSGFQRVAPENLTGEQL